MRITTGDAITWYVRMRNGDSKGKLAEATAGKIVGVARLVFRMTRVERENATTSGRSFLNMQRFGNTWDQYWRRNLTKF